MKQFNSKLLFFGFTDENSPVIKSKIFHEHVNECDKGTEDCACMNAIIFNMFNNMFEANLHAFTVGGIYVNDELIDWGFDHPDEEDGTATEFLRRIQHHIDTTDELSMFVEDLINMKLDQLNNNPGKLSSSQIEEHQNEWLDYLGFLQQKDVREKGSAD